MTLPRGTLLNDFLASLPPSPERTQALVALNGLLTDLNDALAALVTRASEPTASRDDGPDTETRHLREQAEATR